VTKMGLAITPDIKGEKSDQKKTKTEGKKRGKREMRGGGDKRGEVGDNGIGREKTARTRPPQKKQKKLKGTFGWSQSKVEDWSFAVRAKGREDHSKRKSF